MKKNDFVLPILLILLAFFLPCTIYAVNRHNNEDMEKGNPNHLPKVDDRLFFYDKNDELIGTYDCEDAYCEVAMTSVDDIENLHFNDDGHQLATSGSKAVIQDGTLMYVYDLVSNTKVATLTAVKDYGIGLENNYLIVKNENGQYGLLDINSDMIAYIIPASYEFLGAIDKKTDDDKVDLKRIIAKQNGEYFLVDITGEKISNPSKYPIYTYDNNYVYHISDLGYYYIYDYEGTEMFEEMISELKVYDNCVVTQDIEANLKVHSKDLQEVLFEKKYTSFDLKYEYKDDELIITNEADGTFESVDLTGAKENNVGTVNDDENNENELGQSGNIDSPLEEDRANDE